MPQISAQGIEFPENKKNGLHDGPWLPATTVPHSSKGPLPSGNTGLRITSGGIFTSMTPPSMRRVAPPYGLAVELSIPIEEGGMQIALATSNPRLESSLKAKAVSPSTASAFARPSGQIALFQGIATDWGLPNTQAAILLGFDDETVINDLYRGVTTLRQRDANERLRAVLLIAADLELLYEATETIRSWLRESQPMLDGATPLELLTEGSMENVLRLRQYVEYLSGR